MWRFPKTPLLCRSPHGSDADVDGYRRRRMKTLRPELTRHALTIHDLDPIAPLATNRVEVSRTTRHLVLTKPPNRHAGVMSLRTLDCLRHLFSALEFNHLLTPIRGCRLLATDR